MLHVSSGSSCHLIACCGVLLCGAAMAQDDTPPRLRDCWSEFPIGAWTRVRVIQQDCRDHRECRTVRQRESRATLQAIDDDAYVLQLEVQVTVEGKKISSPPQSITRGRARQSKDEPYQIKRQGSEVLAFQGKSVDATVYRVVYGSGATRRVSTLHYCPDICPYILRQSTRLAGNELASTHVDVIAIDMPHAVHTRIRPVTYARTTQKLPGRTKVTFEVYCSDVPGGLVSHASVTRDERGKVIERSSLSLLDFDAGSGQVSDAQSSAHPTRIRRRLRQRARTRSDWIAVESRRD